MQKFTKIKSKIIPLKYKDIDTDMIIPAEYLKTTSKKGLGKYVFINMRPEGSTLGVKKAYTDFPEFKGKQIIVAGKNFGCGSSREHAPWALLDTGIRVIISSEFADIFKLNSQKNGLLLINLEEEKVQELMVNKEEIKIDLEKQEIILSEKKYSFEINKSLKQKFIKGLDDLDYILQFREDIKKFNK